MADLTPEEQFTQMNAPAFFGAAGAKIIAAKNAMTNADVTSVDGCITHLNQVQIWWQEDGENTRVKYGNDLQDNPLYDITIPTQWLAVTA